MYDAQNIELFNTVHYLVYLLPEIHCKSDKPNFTLFILEAVNNCNTSVI